MEKLKRNDKIYLDTENTKESAVNNFLSCRDGIVEVFEYRDGSGYGSPVKLFLCENTKHEVIHIIRQTWNSMAKEWIEDDMSFDTDSFTFLKALIEGRKQQIGGEYTLVRSYC